MIKDLSGKMQTSSLKGTGRSVKLDGRSVKLDGRSRGAKNSAGAGQISELKTDPRKILDDDQPVEGSVAEEVEDRTRPRA